MQEATFLILTALAAGSQHGYGIITDVAEISNGRVRLRAGTLYMALDRLRTDELIAVDREEVVDSPAAPVLPAHPLRVRGCWPPKQRDCEPMPPPRCRAWTWPEGPHERVGGPGGAVPAVAGLVSAVVPARAGRRDARRPDGGRRAGQRRPGLLETADVLRSALWMRLFLAMRSPGPRPRNQRWTDALALFSIVVPLFLVIVAVLEVVYSDLGHCGRKNIQISWIYVKTCLVLNYLGQAVWLLQRNGQTINLNLHNPFYEIMPQWFLLYGIGIATIAAVIASQALISGSFTLIAEAVRLNLWPKVRINYPTEQKGQLYVPSVNWLLCAGCIGVVLLFRHSDKMEAAYGLSITVAMLMTTILVSKFLAKKKFPPYVIGIFLTVYLLIELTFLSGNLVKFVNGGWFTLSVGAVLFSIMWTWHIARKIRNRYMKFIAIEDYFNILKELSDDETVPKYASQLVYLTSANFNSEVESKIIYSILQKQPKRADVYWLVHVDVVDEPYKRNMRLIFLYPIN